MHCSNAVKIYRVCQFHHTRILNFFMYKPELSENHYSMILYKLKVLFIYPFIKAYMRIQFVKSIFLIKLIGRLIIICLKKDT